MEVSADKVVTILYTVTDQDGALVESSDEDRPLAYVHGAGSVIPGLESALEGKSAGDHVQVSVPPEQAFGERQEGLLQTISRDDLDDPDAVRPGMRLKAVDEDGSVVVTVVDVDEQGVTVDANHPLAGATLAFDVRIVDVREATAEERERGRAEQATWRPH